MRNIVDVFLGFRISYVKNGTLIVSVTLTRPFRSSLRSFVAAAVFRVDPHSRKRNSYLNLYFYILVPDVEAKGRR